MTAVVCLKKIRFGWLVSLEMFQVQPVERTRCPWAAHHLDPVWHTDPLVFLPWWFHAASQVTCQEKELYRLQLTQGGFYCSEKGHVSGRVSDRKCPLSLVLSAVLLGRDSSGAWWTTKLSECTMRPCSCTTRIFVFTLCHLPAPACLKPEAPPPPASGKTPPVKRRLPQDH